MNPSARRTRLLDLRRFAPLALLVTASPIVVGCADDAGDDTEDAIARGEALFDAHCAACHGPQGTGTSTGPPLVHQVYEPGHHPDESFHRAVSEGVAPHHWDFGPMPAQPDLDRDEVDDIIAYVRDLQRDAGIID